MHIIDSHVHISWVIISQLGRDIADEWGMGNEDKLLPIHSVKDEWRMNGGQ